MSLVQSAAPPRLAGQLTLVSAGTRFCWLFHSMTFPAQELYAHKWGIAASFYVHPQDMATAWDRLRVWQEGLRQIKPGDWMWFLGPGCVIAELDFDWRSLGPAAGDLIIGADQAGFNFESFLLRSTPEAHLFLQRVRKLEGTVATENEAMTVLIRAELIAADIRPRRALASRFSPPTPTPTPTSTPTQTPTHTQPEVEAAQNAYQIGDLVLQFPTWDIGSFALLHDVTAPYRRAAAAPRPGRIHRTYCIHALGDNMAHLHLLRQLAIRHPEHRFIHQCVTQHLGQLAEMTEDLANISLEPMHRVDLGAIDAWKNAQCAWETHALRCDYAAYFIHFFKQLARRMGLESPIETAEDLLFDYPALQKPTPLDSPFDFLVVNSTPLSGQLSRDTDLDGLIAELAAQYSVIVTQPSAVPGVVCTRDHGLSVSGIGRLSTFCKYIVMISTGSSWGTFNVWNKDSVAFRLILIDNERIGLSKNTVQANTVDSARLLLQEAALL
jgi:hypothetical protein